MKYLLVRTQVGDGCDYAIGCGTAVETIDLSDEISAATSAALEHIAYPDGRDAGRFALDPEYEFNLARAWIVPVSHVYDLDLASARNAHAAARQAADRAHRESEERAMLEKLRAKYPPPA